jgi:hypothetical protein
MRMATSRMRWIATGGATAAVAIGVWAAVALAGPTGLAITPAVTHLPTHLTWTEGAADGTGYDIQRDAGACSLSSAFTTVGTAPAGATSADDTPPGQGTFCYQVVGHYPGGDVPSNSAQVMFDTVAPTVTIAQPTASVVGGVVAILVSASEGTPVISTSPASAISLTSWDTNALTDGTYTISASVTDAAGNVGSGSRAVTVDNHAPGAFTAFGPTTVAGGPTITWTPASDLTNVTYRIQRDGPGGHVQFDGVSSGWSDSDPAHPLALGTYTYTVQAVDALLHVTAAPTLTIVVTAPSASTPQNVSAVSPTNALPHLAWQPPITFAVTGWQIYRDNALVTTLTDPSARSYDDTAVPGQGMHSYVVRALSGATQGDASAPVSVVFDSIAPSLAAVSATPNPNGSISLSWPDAVDTVPGSGLAKYVVRRGSQTSPPSDPAAGTGICTVTLPASTGCIDSATDSGTIYGYSVFAIDAASNLTRQVTSARAFDSLPPDPVTGFRGTVGPTNAHLEWNTPARQGNNADLAGYRVIKLGTGIKQPTNPRDGTEVCPGLGSGDGDCFVQNLSTGVPVTFAIYAMDASNNLSAPTSLTITPNSSDHKKPGLPKKVKIKRVGATITMTWVSPKDRDLSKFRVTLFNNGPAKRPSLGKAIVTGRVLHASFKLKAGQVVYVNLFAIDLSGNFSRVTRLIVMPDKLFQPKSKHKKVAKKKASGTKTPPKKQKTN